MKKKRILNTLIIILTISVIIELTIYTRNSINNSKVLEEVNTKEIFDNKDKTLSIMVQGEDGEYNSSQDRTSWPDPNTYEYEKAECTDSEGNTIASDGIITYQDKTITVKTNKTIYCTLYFKNLNYSQVLYMLKSTTTDTYLKPMADKDELLRFVGTNTDADEHKLNNYICFGTDNESTCINNKDTYMYRIIGLTTENVKSKGLGLVDNQLKMIKATPSNTSIKWSKDYTTGYCGASGAENGNCKWEYSGADASSTPTSQYYLNHTFLETLPKTAPWNSIIDSDVKWYVGDYSEYSFNPSITSEKSSITSSTYKIGLMYASDFYYSVNTYKTSSPYNKDSWLYIQNGITGGTSGNEWTMIRYGLYNGSRYEAWRVHSDGYLNSNTVNLSNAVRPVFFLTSNIKLKGQGTEEHSFLISV